MTPLRIALVAPDCHRRDGQARYVSEVASALADRGHDVHVFSVGFDDTDPARVTHHAVRAPRRSARLRFPVFLARATLALRRHAADRGAFDIVHGVGASALHMDVMTVEFCQAAWDEVLRHDAPELAGGLAAALSRRLIAAVEGRLLAGRRLRRVIAVSRRVAHDLARLHRRTDGVVVLPNGVDLERFHPRLRAEGARLREHIGVPTTAFLVAFLGELERKNLKTLVAALARLADPRVVVVAAGRSDPAPYRALARELGVEASLRLLPETAEPERLLAAADAFAFPTLYEPFGMVALEAAACATPVVASARAGFSEWLEDGRSGLVLADPLDAGALAAKLAHLLRDPEQAAAMGRRAREVAERFSWDAIAGETERLYAEVRTLKSPRSA